MEKYIVSARKYRPSSFKTIVGQHALSNTLKNAVLTGRLAQLDILMNRVVWEKLLRHVFLRRQSIVRT